MTDQSKVEHIPIDRIVVDPAYHRIDSAGWVTGVQPLLVNQRSDGTFAILDGQNRFNAMKRAGWTQAPVEIEHHPTLEEEAQRFVDLNNQVFHERVKAGLMGLDDFYREVIGIVAVAHLLITFAPELSPANQVRVQLKGTSTTTGETFHAAAFGQSLGHALTAMRDKLEDFSEGWG